MSNNNELCINNNYVKIKKRKPNRILDKKQEINNYKYGSKCLTLEKTEDNKKNDKIKTINNRRINVSKSYNNFYTPRRRAALRMAVWVFASEIWPAMTSSRSSARGIRVTSRNSSASR